jgi:antitoxin ParD1/3/4
VPTRNVVLTDDQDALISVLVSSGRYQNASEVIREGLRLIQRREAEDAAKLAALRTAARAGLGALESGAFSEFNDPDALGDHLTSISERHDRARARRH